MDYPWLQELSKYVGQAFVAAITFVGSILVAWFTAWRTSRSEVLKTYRQKRIAIYDDLLAFLDSFRRNPDLALDEEFYSQSLVLSNHLRVYGSKAVVSAIKAMTESLYSDYYSYQGALNQLYVEHTRRIPYQSDPEQAPDYVEQIDDPETLDQLEDELRNRYRKTQSEAFDLINPVLQSIQESAYSGRK